MPPFYFANFFFGGGDDVVSEDTNYISSCSQGKVAL